MSYIDKRNWITASAAGFTQAIVGHPLDTVKVLMQNSDGKSRLLAKGNIATIMSQLMRGVTPPLILAGISGSVIYGTERYFYDNCTNGNHYLSGFYTGVVTTPIVSPLEYAKIQLQMGHRWPTSWFRGIFITSARRVPAGPILFGVQHDLREKYNFSSFASGMTAGMLMWVLLYPVDVVKSRVQAHNDVTYLNALKQGNLWRGITPCLLRAGIVFGTGFKVRDLVSSSYS